MTQLNDISHDTNFAHISITRLGDSRSTDYRISQSEAKPESEEKTTAPIAVRKDISNEYARWKDAKFINH